MKPLLVIVGAVAVVAVAVLLVTTYTFPIHRTLSTATVVPSVSSEAITAPSASPVNDGCFVSGCSSQVCSDTPVITTCEWRQEYVCYRTAECARQDDGRCGWTQTPELISCLAQFRTP